MPAITGPTYLTAAEIRAASTAQFHPLGVIAETLGGRTFRYIQAAGTALVKGNLLQGPANVANHINQVVGDAGSVDDMFINIDSGNTAGTINQYADGFIIINDEAGEGICYRVSGHAAWSGNATSVRINLSEPVDQALTADTSNYSLHSIYRDVIQNPTAATNIAVAVADVAYAVDEYFWGQTRGVSSVLQEATAAVSVIGGAYVPSDTTAGAVEITAQAVTALQEVARALVVSVDGEHNAVYLTLD